MANRLQYKGMDLTQPALAWVGRPNGEKVASICVQFDLDQSGRKSSKVSVSARLAKQTNK